MAELREEQGAELVKQLNKEIHMTGWYAVSGNKIQWINLTRDTKKEQIEQEKT